MLSYQHGYHAGNPGDVHKHALLAWMLDYLSAKPKPLSYLETHAGRGLYDLGGPQARKTAEAEGGIGRAMREGWFPSDHPYRRRLELVRALHGPTAYPGSPLLAALSLRPGDPMDLAELHPAEVAALRAALAPLGARVHQRDGLEMARALTPPTPRRGLMLIDPSYEVKADYEAMAPAVLALHRRWPVGVIVLWYPLLPGDPHAPMLAALEGAALPRALRHEVRFAPLRAGHRMTGSGLLVVNAPYGTEAEAARLGTLFAAAGS